MDTSTYPPDVAERPGSAAALLATGLTRELLLVIPENVLDELNTPQFAENSWPPFALPDRAPQSGHAQ
ncbi:hypothetical protein [Nocardia sp. NPDC057455]|uniref:hypothetical protein n=1 Tax=Nocardia sp. NPDC057455 TaxID=3346138 RepID=UPI00366C7D46